MRVRQVQRCLGLFYLAAGVGKFFPQIESVEEALVLAVDAHTGTRLGPFMRWMHPHHRVVQYGLAAVLLSLGTALTADRELVDEALVASLVMLVAFMVLLQRSHPHVVAVDMPFVLVTLALLVARRMANSEPGTVQVTP